MNQKKITLCKDLFTLQHHFIPHKMRLWSIHPRYLDAKGLTACWREALLARKVLQGLTRGYRNHPQLVRFRAMPHPTAAIDCYLQALLAESQSRGYHFDGSRIELHAPCERMKVTRGQIEYEVEHLKKKLKVRDRARYEYLTKEPVLEAHPLFDTIEGEVETWEKR